MYYCHQKKIYKNISMKKILIFIFILSSAVSLHAQQSIIDSLKLKLTKTATDTGRVRLLTEIGAIYSSVYSLKDSSLFYLQKALAIAQQHNQPKMEAGVRAEIYVAQAFSNIRDNRDTAFYWMHQALSLCRKNNLKEQEIGLLQVLTNMGSPLFEADSIEPYFTRGMELAKQEQSHQTEKLFLKYYGFFHYSKGNYFIALQANLQALDIMKEDNDASQIPIMLYNIGNVYFRAKDYRHSLSSLFDGKKLAENIKDSASLSGIMIKIGENYIALHQQDSARIFADKAYHIANIFYHGHILGGFLNDLGVIYSGLGEDSLAMAYFRQSFPNFLKTSNLPRNICESLLGMAQIFGRTGLRDSAFHYASKAFLIATENNAQEYILGASELLKDFYKSKHLMDSAFKYQSIEVATKDSLFSQEKVRELQNISFNEKIHQQELTTAALQYKNKLRMYVLAGGLLVLLLVVIGLVRNNISKRRANDILNKKNEEIESTLSELKSTQAQLIQSEKMASLGELTAGIAHEIQNPLNFVNNFSEVNKEMLDEMKDEINKGNYEEVKSIANDVIENEQKINHHGKRADAIVKGMLQHSRTSSGQKEMTDINALCDEYLRLAYHGLRAKDKTFNAEIKTDFDNSIGKINIVPQDIGRVLLNLINNAFYAVNEKQKTENSTYVPTVAIVTKNLNEKVEIKVSDNGNGIPQNIIDKIFQPFFTTKPTGSGTGLGLSLSYDTVKTHGGEIKVNAKDGEGTEFIIQLPVT
jgi:signal transduction histidine kinase